MGSEKGELTDPFHARHPTICLYTDPVNSIGTLWVWVGEMSRSIIILGICTVLALSSLGPLYGPRDAGVGDYAAIENDAEAAREVPRDLGRLLEGVSGGFVENRGQVANADVRYYAKGDRLTVGLTPTGMVVTVREGRAPSGADGDPDEVPSPLASTFAIDFEGCAPTEPRARGAAGHVSNFFLGNDPERWVRGAPSYPEVYYQGVWPGVDMRFCFRDGALKYEFIAGTGADGGRVALHYRDVCALGLDSTTGELLISLSNGELRDSCPIIFQEGVLSPEGTVGGFKVDNCNMVRFILPAECNPARPLVIDPGLEFSTLWGGRSEELTDDVGIDEDGNVYLVGNSMSDDLRVTPGAFNSTLNGLSDIFVAKFDPTLSTLLFATYMGGFSQNDEAMTLRVVQDDGLYMVGYTESSDFPTTPGTVAPIPLGGRDIFVSLLSLDGSTLLKSTFLGGNDLDVSKSIEVMSNGDIYITGRTKSANLPTTLGAYDRTWAGGNRGDCCVFRLNKAMDRILFCTYLGGPGEEQYQCMSIDKDGNIYVMGQTQSRFFPITSGAFCATYNGGDYDGFISKLSPDGSQLLSSTFIGGNNTEWPWDMEYMDNGSVVVSWYSLSTNFPTTGDAYCRTSSPKGDMVLTIMDPNLTRLEYSTFLGGSSTNRVFQLVWDQVRRNLYTVGISDAPSLPCTVGAYDTVYRGGNADVIIVGFDMQSLSLSYLSYLGGTDYDTQGYAGLVMDAKGRLLFAGYTSSTDFPTTSKANRTTNNGSYDAYLVWFDPTPVGAPNPPTGLVATAGNGYVDLSWTVPFNESYRLVGQRIFRGTTPGNMARLADIGLNGVYVDTDVTNGVTYYYEVATVNSAGESVKTPAVNATPLGPPSEPLDLVATTGNGTIELAWQRPTELGGRLGGYHVLRGLAADALEPLAMIGPTERYIDNDVGMGTTYFYAVLAYNDMFNGTTSKVVRIKALGLPSAPTDLAAVPGNHTLALSWSAPVEDGGSTLLAYYIYTSPTGDGWTFLATVLPTTPSYKHLGLENGLTYHYRVTAVSIIGEGPPGEPVGASPIGAPGMPRVVVATGLDGNIRLTWEAPLSNGGSIITGYRVYGGSLVDALGLLHAGDALARDFTHAPVPNGETRYYAVSALNAKGEGERSPIVQATTMGLPSAPLGLTAAISNGTVHLSWAPPEDDGGSPSLTYRVLRGTSPDALSPLATLEEVLELTDPDVSKGASYYYEVVAINIRGGAGSPSEVVRVDMLGLPGIPVNVTAIARDRTVSLTWGPPSIDPDAPVEAYAVLRGTSAGDLQEIARVRVTLYDDRDPTLVNGVLYYYAISAINKIGEGTRTSPVPAKPLPPPRAPTLTASEDDGEVVLEWTAPTGDAATATGYLLYRGTDLSDLKVVAELGTVTNYTDSYLKPGQTYHYRVRATSLSGDGALSEPASVKLPEEVGEATWLMPALIGLIIIVALLAGALMMRGRGGAKGGPE